MKLASLDIEISDQLTSPGEPGFPPHISCAAIALSDDPENVRFYQAAEGNEQMTAQEVEHLSEKMPQIHESGYTFLTWNGVSFDYQVIAANCNNTGYSKLLLDQCWCAHIDMMLLVTFQTGYRLSLDAALAGAGLAGKLHNVTLSDGTPITDMSGAKAPELWRAGERAAVLQYLQQDVIQPLELARHTEVHKALRWTSKKGKMMFIDVPELYTVAEAYRNLPEPEDVSWLTDPILREPYIRKYLPYAL